VALTRFLRRRESIHELPPRARLTKKPLACTCDPFLQRGVAESRAASPVDA